MPVPSRSATNMVVGLIPLDIKSRWKRCIGETGTCRNVLEDRKIPIDRVRRKDLRPAIAVHVSDLHGAASIPNPKIKGALIAIVDELVFL